MSHACAFWPAAGSALTLAALGACAAAPAVVEPPRDTQNTTAPQQPAAPAAAEQARGGEHEDAPPPRGAGSRPPEATGAEAPLDPPVDRPREARGSASQGSEKVAKTPGIFESPGRTGAVETEGSRFGGKVRRERPRRRAKPRASSPADAKPRTSRAAAPARGGGVLKAGRHDDNAEYNRFVRFMHANRKRIPYPVLVQERLVVQAVDRDGASLPNCRVAVADPGDTDFTPVGKTYADGKTHFFPRVLSFRAASYVGRVQCGKQQQSVSIERRGPRTIRVQFPHGRQLPNRIPVDIAIVIDTTGSMGGQIERLRATLKAIHHQLTQLETQPDIRFGMVAYRDLQDAYVTRVTPFTRDVHAFQGALDALEAMGGGDTPEDLQNALHDALTRLEWRPDGLRLGFIVSDAPPHTDYGQKYTYVNAMQESLKRGIQWTAIGAGGLNRTGEIVFRQIAQYTRGEYVFVTRGGPKGNREGGSGEASHHVGSNYQVEKLDQAIVRIVRSTLSHLTASPREFDRTIVAQTRGDASPDVLWAPAAREVIRQLVDYSAIRLRSSTPVAVLPVSPASDAAAVEGVAEALTAEIVLAASRHRVFRVLERDLDALAREIELQLSAAFDVEETVQLGSMVGAEALVLAKVQQRADGLVLFAKLVRVATGEILSVSRVAFADVNTI